MSTQTDLQVVRAELDELMGEIRDEVLVQHLIDPNMDIYFALFCDRIIRRLKIIADMVQPEFNWSNTIYMDEKDFDRWQKERDGEKEVRRAGSAAD